MRGTRFGSKLPRIDDGADTLGRGTQAALAEIFQRYKAPDAGTWALSDLQRFLGDLGNEDLAISNSDEFDEILLVLDASKTGFEAGALGRLFEMVELDVVEELAKLPGKP